MKILFFSDIHFHHTHRFSHITNEGFTTRELEQYQCAEDILSIAKEENVDKIIFGGDMFGPVGDNISTQTLNIVCKFVKKISEVYPFEMIVGNHDQSVLTQNSNIHKLESFKFWQNCYVYDMPTIKDNIVYMPYCYSDEYAEAFLNNIEDKANKIVVSHLELKDIPLGNGITSKHGVSLDILKKFKMVFQGHYHSISSYAKNIKIIGSVQRFSFKDMGSSKNNIIIYDTETNTVKRKSFNAPDWLTFTDENIENILSISSNNYVKVDVSTDILITDEIKAKLDMFKGKDIHIDINRISINKEVLEESNMNNMNEIDVLEKFILESNNSDEQKESLIIEGKRLLEISK